MNKLNGIILTLGLWLVLCGTATATQLYVNDSGWWQEGGAFNANGTPIQAAVDAAREGDSIYVWNGSYNENVNVNKRLTLEGEGADVVIVTAATSSTVFKVTADYVNITGFAVRGATDSYAAGICLINADYCDLSGNNAYGNQHGIFLSGSNNNTLTNNTANLNYPYGIRMGGSSNNTLTDNTANSNNYYGIALHTSNDNTLQSNAVSNNNYGIKLYDSSDNTLQSNAVSNNNYGIKLWSLSNNTMTNNNASNNNYGIHLYDADDNVITCNCVQSNTQNGIHLYNADDNNITCNCVQSNKQGIYLTSGSTGNNISYNNIIRNGDYNTEIGGWEWQFYMDQYNPVEAKHNYWDAGMNNSTIDASIYDDDEGMGKVKFYPFETEPVLCAPGPKRPAFTAADAVIALQIAVGSRPPDPRWDVSGDGSVTSLDALMILQAAAEGIEIG